jgi:hypothetical protein
MGGAAHDLERQIAPHRQAGDGKAVGHGGHRAFGHRTQGVVTREVGDACGCQIGQVVNLVDPQRAIAQQTRQQQQRLDRHRQRLENRRACGKLDFSGLFPLFAAHLCPNWQRIAVS